ncbi:MAG: serine/threonine protein kinase [Acidobacteria bacterium]|nr:serine/threonine protein kinase [Acidobacteriota bacterium]
MLNRAIGNYRIVGEIAKGGMGTVYRAHHLHLPREVVIKSIQLDSYSESAQDVLKARFRREAFIQSQLDHPNIVRVLEFFRARDNYYLVMEYVSGVSLRELLDKQGIPAPKQALYLFKQVLSALSYAHTFSYLDEEGNRQRGIIHRDINPSNLLLDHQGRVKITDFGTVKTSGAARLTQLGFHPGTLEYMSPEQVRGIEIDARSDIYSAGVTLYEMLTGRLPFPLTHEGADWEVRKGHVEQAPPSITKLKPEVSSELAAIVRRALEKSPADRYQTAAEFMAAIKALKPAAVECKKKVRGYDRKFDGTKSIVVKTIIKPDPVLFQQRVANIFEFGDAVTIPVSPFMPRLSTISQNEAVIERSSQVSVTRSAKASQTSDGLPKKLKELIAKYNPSRNPILQGALAILLAGAFVFFSTNNGKPALQSAMANMEKSSAEANSAHGVTTLNQAQELEKQENYGQAIPAYEQVLIETSKAEERDALRKKLVDLRTFQNLLGAGQIAEREDRVMAARRHYLGALEIRPNSEIAKKLLVALDQKQVQPQR